MKEYGVVDSWTKQFTIDLSGEILRVFRSPEEWSFINGGKSTT